MKQARLIKSDRQFQVMPYIFVLPFITIYVVFILIPAIGIIVKSLTSNNIAAFEIFNPELMASTKFTLKNYYLLFTESWSLKVLFSTISIAFISVVAALIIGTPIAYILSKESFKSRKIVRWFLYLPVYLPIVITAFALVWFFNNMGVVNTILKSITGHTVPLAYTYPSVILGTIAVIIPVYVRTVTPAFESISPEIFEASLSLGAGEIKTLWSVILPISKPIILAGIVMIFSMTIGMMEIAFLMGGGGLKVQYMPIEIFQKALSPNPDIPFASAMATVLLSIAFVAQLFSMSMLRRTRK